MLLVLMRERLALGRCWQVARRPGRAAPSLPPSRSSARSAFGRSEPGPWLSPPRRISKMAQKPGANVRRLRDTQVGQHAP